MFSVERVKTGIPGFDALVGGGIPKGDTILISGDAGTGKTLFCLQVLYNNALSGKNCLYITLEQSLDSIKKEMAGFNFNLDKVKGKLNLVSLSAISPAVVDQIISEINKKKYDFIALDSLAAIAASPVPPAKELALKEVLDVVYPVPITEEQLVRNKIMALINVIGGTNATTFLVSEIIEGEKGLSRDTYSEFLVDDIVLFHYLGVASTKFRSLQIRKMRHSAHEEEIINYQITKTGLELVKEKQLV